MHEHLWLILCWCHHTQGIQVFHVTGGHRIHTAEFARKKAVVEGVGLSLYERMLLLAARAPRTGHMICKTVHEGLE